MASDSHILEGLNEPQREAVETLNGPLGWLPGNRRRPADIGAASPCVWGRHRHHSTRGLAGSRSQGHRHVREGERGHPGYY